MANSMNLTIPTVSQTIGPTYANEINADLALIAEHNHTSDKGVQVPVAGLDIDDDLDFGDTYNVTGLRSARFDEQADPLSDPTDIDCVYSVDGDLYWNNGSGVAVQITAGNVLNASAIGGFTGLAGTIGAATYNSGLGLFTFTSATNAKAALSCGPLTISDTAPSANGVTIQGPVGLGAPYSLTLPAALPGSTALMTLSSGGTISTGQAQTADIADGAVTKPKLAALGQQQSAELNVPGLNSTTYADVTGASVTITTTGRPLVVCLVARATAGSAISLSDGAASGGSRNAWLALSADGGAEFAVQSFGSTDFAASEQLLIPPGAFWHLYTPAAGTYTIQLRYKVDTTDAALGITGVLTAFEL